MFSKTSGQLLREHTRNPRHLDLHPHTRHREMFMRQDCCARTPLSVRKTTCSGEKDCCVLTPRAHLDLFPYANRHVRATTLLHSHAVSTLGSHSVRKRRVPAKKVLRSRREHTWISLRAQTDMFMRQHCCVLIPRAHLELSLCKQEDMFMRQTAAFTRHKHTWISFRAQARRHVHATDCCVHTPHAHLDLFPCAERHVPQNGCCVLTPRAHLDLAPCAKRHVPSKRLLRSRAALQDR